jgi:8-oxo-dGTP pyrophosphatase MutT (NUDIX family)
MLQIYINVITGLIMLSTELIMLSTVLYKYYKNKKYIPSSKWFILTEKNGNIEIIPKFKHLEDQIDALINAPKFIAWLNKFDPDEITLRSITITDIDWFSKGYVPSKLGFVKCASEAYDFKTGKKIVSNISFVRGNSVAILILVSVLNKDSENDKDYVLLCEQHRLPIGKKAKEIPAGMMDSDGNIISVALKEVREETGFNICHVDELQSLGLYYASPCGLDEEIYLFAWTTVVSATVFEEKQKQMYGLAEENEEIKLSFVELEKFKTDTVYKIGDAKAEIALSRYLSKKF